MGHRDIVGQPARQHQALVVVQAVARPESTGYFRGDGAGQPRVVRRPPPVAISDAHPTKQATKATTLPPTLLSSQVQVHQRLCVRQRAREAAAVPQLRAEERAVVVQAGGGGAVGQGEGGGGAGGRVGGRTLMCTRCVMNCLRNECRISPAAGARLGASSDSYAPTRPSHLTMASKMIWGSSRDGSCRTRMFLTNRREKAISRRSSIRGSGGAATAAGAATAPVATAADDSDCSSADGALIAPGCCCCC